jgi:hypothetical protein
MITTLLWAAAFGANVDFAFSQTLDFAVRIKFGFDVDCNRPFTTQNYPVSAKFDAFVPAEGKASADLVLSIPLSPRIHFDAQPNGASTPAPGGYSSLNVYSGGNYLAVWDLPNNQFLLSITRHNHSCKAQLFIKLRPDAREYSIYAGVMNYCSRIELRNISCETN